MTSGTPPPLTSLEEEQRDIDDLATGAAANFLGKAARISRGGFIWVVTLLCGLEIQALYSLTWGFASTLNKIGRFGLQRGVVRHLIEAKARDDAQGAELAVAVALRLGLLVSCAVTVAMLLTAGWVESFYGKPIAASLRIMSFSTPFMSAAWTLGSAIRALRIMRYNVYVMSICGPLFLLGGGLVVGFSYPTLEGISWVQLAMTIVVSLLSAYYYRRFYSLGNTLRHVLTAPGWKPLARFSFPVMITDLLRALLTQLDVLMLGRFVPQDQIYLVGVYVLARRLASAVLKAPQAVDPIFSPVVSELAVRERFAELGQRFVVVSRWILFVNLPIFATILTIGGTLLPLIAGTGALTRAEVEVGIRILYILCAGMTVFSAFSSIGTLLTMSGRPYLNMANNVVWLVANFLLNLWFIDRFGIIGAALGATLSRFLVNALWIGEVYGIHDILPFHRSQAKPLVAAAVGAGVGWLLGQALPEPLWSAAGFLTGFLTSYFVMLFALGIEPEERDVIGRFGARVMRWRLARS
jgi:O-antigen/teichoic acid export membrane protein